MDNKKNNNNITAKDVKILVAYHKPAVLVKNEILTPIHLGRALGNEISKDGALSNEDYQWMLDNMIGDDTGDNISNKNRRYNELTAIYWAWKNQDKLGNPKYIGLMHYRRQLVFNTQQEDYYKENSYLTPAGYGFKVENKLLTTKDVEANCNVNDILLQLTQSNIISSKPATTNKTVTQHYKLPHCISLGHVPKDIDLMVSVINKLYPTFNNVTNAYLNNNLHYWCNLFVMPVADFNHYCQWLFDILFEIEKQIDYSNRNALQQRALGFLAERLTGIYITYLKQKHSINHKYTVWHTNTDLIKPINPSFNHNNIPIVFSCDNNYAPYLAVAIQSIIENASSNNNYDIFILNEDFSQDTKNKILLQIKNKPNVNITFVAIKHYLKNVDTSKFYIRDFYSLATYYRFFIPRIFSNFSKMLYLDADLVSTEDVANLYNTDLKNKMLAASRDVCVVNPIRLNYFKTTLKRNNADNYFNAGVLLINLQKARTHNFEIDCINKSIELKKPFYVDQDVLNVLYENDVEWLPINWNILWHLPFHHVHAAYISNTELPIVKQYFKAYKNPKIIHYCSDAKPWLLPHQPLAHHFWQYAKNTAFYEEILFTNINKQVQSKIPKPVNNVTPANNYAKQIDYLNTCINNLYAQKILAKKHKKLKYKLIYKLSFGKLRKKYKNKYKILKAQIKQAKVLLKKKDKPKLK